MRWFLAIVFVTALVYVALYPSLFNACRGYDLGHSRLELEIPAALLGLPLMQVYPWDEEKLGGSDPAIDFRDRYLVCLLLGNGAFWGCMAAGIVLVVRRLRSGRLASSTDAKARTRQS